MPSIASLRNVLLDANLTRVMSVAHAHLICARRTFIGRDNRHNATACPAQLIFGEPRSFMPRYLTRSSKLFMRAFYPPSQELFSPDRLANNAVLVTRVFLPFLRQLHRHRMATVGVLPGIEVIDWSNAINIDVLP